MKKHTPKILKLGILYLLLGSILFVGLPTVTRAQTDGQYEKAGKPVFLTKSAQKKFSKMSADSFSELMRTADQNGTAVAKVRNKEGREIKYSVLNVEFRSPALRRAVFSDQKITRLRDTYVLTAIDRFADVFVSTDAAWDALYKHKDVVRVEYQTDVTAPPPPKVTPSELVSQAVAEKIVRGGYKGLTGKNVIIAVLDSGIDFRHPDFITYDSQGRPTSRIAYLWDTHTQFQQGRGSEAPFKYPNGTSIGTLYTKQHLTSELRSSAITIPATDLGGHGTACASVAAGNGNADKRNNGLKRKAVEGVAPDADIIGVRLGKAGMENAYLLNAIAEWLEGVAGKTPLVISGSFGGHYTGHDGQRVSERQLNTRFPLNKSGRAIVFAAGNEGNDRIHAKSVFSKEAKLVSWNAGRPTLVKIYFDSADKGLNIIGTKATPFKKNSFVASINPITGQLEVILKVDRGIGGIWLENKSGAQSEAHLYFTNRANGAFSPNNVTFSHLVASPGATENAITVGSFDWNDNFQGSNGRLINLTSVCRNTTGGRMPFEVGWLSCYSSPGPNRDGKVKPEIVAPGEWFTSSYAKIPGGGGVENWDVDSTGNYVAMNGTSAATPYTSGIIALMFQKKPSLTLGEVKRLLKASTSKSGLNGLAAGSGRAFPSRAIPNNNWGYGKLDISAIDKIFASLDKTG